MGSTYFSSLSGMLAASYGLQNTSNNIANMQNPGFKRSEVFYSSLGNNGHSEEGLGCGVRAKDRYINFSPGKNEETSTTTDLAIDGHGFFMVRLENGELIYTRDGEFVFNKDGFLIDKHSNGLVQAVNKSGHLAPVCSKGPAISPGKASRYLQLSGKFSILKKSEEERNSQTGEFRNLYANTIIELQNVYDANGKSHKITLEFESTLVKKNENPGQEVNDKGLSWDLVKIRCDDYVEIPCPYGQQLNFIAMSGPETNKDKITFNWNNQEIQVGFGNANSNPNEYVTIDEPMNPTAKPEITVYKNDGYKQGKQRDLSIDQNGQVSYEYDNGQSIKGTHIALAYFDDMQNSLIQTTGNQFKAKSDAIMEFGQANTGRFGKIESKKLENSNVNATMEFANIVVLQRMFQACSQIMDIEKQLVEHLAGKL